MHEPQLQEQEGVELHKDAGELPHHQGGKVTPLDIIILLKAEESFGVKLAEVVAAIAWVGHPLVIIVMDVAVFYHSWELHALQILAQ